ncbi:M15 family metallopeptidase [Phreatobacter stygius]|uniref:M15 family metallopeptidase n=1 Tax=Phreatobacter stygius TaxID=1940610 RepID=A0A4D7AWN5_9HYPH|nr:M15 family metallopeptidase [Phreatobacter stygius]QCI65539.1 M15 family metallopeptidase [Phreatobacter stygius]
MSRFLTPPSLAQLDGVHADLRRVVLRAAAQAAEAGTPFEVTEGRRSLARQRQLVRDGKSRTLQSRHLGGFAVDVVATDGGKPHHRAASYQAIARSFAAAAAAEGVRIRWGGHIKGLFDGRHFELDRVAYPDPTAARLQRRAPAAPADMPAGGPS